MSLYQAACLGQVVAAVGVLCSLVFVGLQIQQSTHFQRLTAVDALSTAIACINVPGMETPALGEALSIASQDWSCASREQRIIAHYFLFSYFKLAENAWYQKESGMIEPAQWFGWENMTRMYYHSNGVQRVWWPRRHNAFSKSFQAYLSSMAPPDDFSSLSEVFDDAPVQVEVKGDGNSHLHVFAGT